MLKVSHVSKKLMYILCVAEKECVKRYLNKYSNDLKKSWTLVNNIRGLNKTYNTSSSQMVDVNGQMIKDPYMIASQFKWSLMLKKLSNNVLLAPLPN